MSGWGAENAALARSSAGAVTTPVLIVIGPELAAVATATGMAGTAAGGTGIGSNSAGSGVGRAGGAGGGGGAAAGVGVGVGAATWSVGRSNADVCEACEAGVGNAITRPVVAAD